MSPDFLLRHLRVQPRSNAQAEAVRQALPLCVELSGVGLIPAELREAAQKSLDAYKDEPRYVQQRRIRILINKAKAERGDLAAIGIESVEQEIDDTLASGPLED